MRFKRFLPVFSMIALAMLAVGCAEAPETEMKEAQTGLDDARNSAQADIWAPDEFQSAKSSFDAANAEVEEQNERFGLTRSYDKAQEMYAQVKTDAEKAKRAAISNKEAAKIEAGQKLEEATAAIESARAALSKAPRTKGTRADIALLTSDLDGLDQSLEEVRGMITSEDYHGAISRATAVSQEAGEMSTMLSEATMRARR